MADTINKRTEPVTPKGVNHLVLNVRNMAESHHFWSDLLGFQQVVGPRHAADDEQVVAVIVHLGSLVHIDHIFQRQVMQAEFLTDRLQSRNIAQSGQVDPPRHRADHDGR